MNATVTQLVRQAAVLALLLAPAGCKTTTAAGDRPATKQVTIGGYKVGPVEKQDSVNKLFVPRATLGSKVREPHLQTEFTDVLINEFTREQSFEIVKKAEDADGILKVTLTEVEMNSVRYVDKAQNEQARGVPVEYTITIHANVALIDTRSGEPLWNLEGMKGRYDFTPSADFGDAKREALLQASGDLAREIVDAASEQW